jgi:hypothetical protein
MENLLNSIKKTNNFINYNMNEPNLANFQPVFANNNNNYSNN